MQNSAYRNQEKESRNNLHGVVNLCNVYDKHHNYESTKNLKEENEVKGKKKYDT